MTRITTPFTATTTADQVIEGLDLTGRRAIVTGATSGIGWETARALAKTGAEVTIAARDTAKGQESARRIRAESPDTNVHVARLDLGDLESVRAFVAGWNGPLHILVANAGIMAIPELMQLGAGWESQFAMNHLGHAELMLELHGALAAGGDARVVVVSSNAHLMGPVDFDDLDFHTRGYERFLAYGQSKAAQVLFAAAAAEQWQSDGICVNSLNPGIMLTGLQRHLDDATLAWIGAKDDKGNTLEVPQGWKTIPQGAATSTLLAASPLVDGVTGRYFEDLQEAEVVDNPDPRGSGLARWATDPAAIHRMWDVTLQLLGR